MKRVFSLIIVAVLVLACMPVIGHSTGENNNPIWLANIMLPNEFYIQTYEPVENLWGWIAPVGTPRPADGVIPDDAVKFEPCTLFPFYDYGSSFSYYSGTLNLSGLTGSYVLYMYNDGTWHIGSNRTGCNVYIDNGVVTHATFGAYDNGDDISSPDWNEIIGQVESSLEGSTINVKVFAGWLIYNTPMTMTLVNEFDNTVVETKAVSYGDMKTDWNYGHQFYTDFQLPNDEGFYKVYFSLHGLDIQASKAFWVDEDSKLTEIELNGINGTPFDRVLVEPLDYVKPDYYYFPPVLDLASPNESYFFDQGSNLLLDYSLDGGNTWKGSTSKVGINGKVISQEMLKTAKKKGSCQLALKLLRSNSNGFISETEEIMVFPVVNAQQDKPKLTVNYQALYLNGGTTPTLYKLSQQTFWALTEPKSDTIVRENIQISPLREKGDSPYIWYDMPAIGVAVKPLYVTNTVRGGKVTYKAKKQSAFYAIRIGAVKNSDGSYTLPSKHVNISVCGLEVPKTIKPNYKKEIVKPPKDTEYELNRKRGVGNGKTTASIEDSDSEKWEYRKLPTRKKAASAPVSHQIAPRTQFASGTTLLSNGKLKVDKTLEFQYSSGGKWGSFKAPKGEQSGEILVRVKASGKMKSTIAYVSSQAQSAIMLDSPAVSGSEEMNQRGQWLPSQTVELASEEYRFTYIWGEAKNKNGKTVNGIVSYKFEPING